MVYLAYATDYSQNHKQRFKILARKLERIPGFRMLYFIRNIRGLDVLAPYGTDRSLANHVIKAAT